MRQIKEVNAGAVGDMVKWFAGVLFLSFALHTAIEGGM